MLVLVNAWVGLCASLCSDCAFARRLAHVIGVGAAVVVCANIP